MTNSISTTNSPLTEADPASLDELFDRDPLELQTKDIEYIVTTLRRQRLAWEQEETTAKRAGRRASSKASKEAAAKITLDNLELDI